MFSKFSEEAQKVLMLAKKEMQDLRHPYVGSEHLLLAILNQENEISKKLEELSISYDLFREELIRIVGIGKEQNPWFLYTPLLKRVIENAILTSKEANDSEVSTLHLFLSLLEEGDGVAIRILSTLSVDWEDLYDLFSTKLVNKNRKSKKKLMIEEFGQDLTKKAQTSELDPVIGREEELSRLIEILSRRTKNNPLLVGEAGVGKTAVVEELARRIVHKQVPETLQKKRIISVAIAGLVAGTKYRGEFEERINKILKELEHNDEIILFIDEIHTLIGAGGAEGAIDASNILKPALARGKFQMIGATTTEEYKKTIEQDKAFDRRFQIVRVDEPNLEKTYNILLKLAPLYESFHGVRIEPELLKEIVTLTDRYIYQRKQPDKSIDILDEVCARVSLKESKDNGKLREYYQQLTKVKEEKNTAIIDQNFDAASALKKKENNLLDRINRLELKSFKETKVKMVTRAEIVQVIEKKTSIPIYEFSPTSYQTILHLEDNLKDKVFGQDEAIEKLCRMTKRMKLGFKEDGRPISFLFVGPTGVGKTELVKEYAHLLFDKEHFLRLDMSEYKESHSLSKLIGSPPGYVGYEDQKNKLEMIRLHPHSLILLDEIEKAHPSVLNLFLQILDEGHITDSRGNEIRFDHTVIIMTSNIGFGREEIGFCKTENSVHTKLKEFLNVEFVNRIGEVILFSPLSEEVVREIIEKQMKEIRTRFSKRGIHLKLHNHLIDEILVLSKYQEYGARQVAKVIESRLDGYIIDQMLSGKQSITIGSIQETK